MALPRTHRPATPSFAKSLIDQAVADVLLPMRRLRLVGGLVAASALGSITLVSQEAQAATLVTGAPSVSVSDPTIGEGNAGTVNLVYTLTRTGDLSQRVLVRYTTGATGDTATAGTDYVSASGTAEFAPGAATTTVSVAVNGDTAAEAAETVTLKIELQRVGGGVVGFTGPQFFFAGNGAYSVATADFNGDGKPDLATANYTSDNITVLLNNTAPGAAAAAFFPGETFGSANGHQDLVAADFNRDGKPDIAFVSLPDAGTILLNTTPTGATTASFAPPLSFFAGDQPRGIDAADINGDFNPDILICSANDNAVRVFLNTTPAAGTVASFAAPVSYTAGLGPFDILAGDFDGDGRPDFAVAAANGGGVFVRLNQTPLGAAVPAFGFVAAFVTGNVPRRLGLADFNDDGKLDISVANTMSNNVSVLLNNLAGTGTAASFAPAQNFPVGSSPLGVAARDLNGDGRPDLAVCNFDSSSVSVLVNTGGSGTTTAAFTAAPSLTNVNGAAYVVAQDINADGKPDLAAASFGTGQVIVFLNTSAEVGVSFQQTFFSDAGSKTASAVADFTGDGFPEIVVTGSTDTRIYPNITAAGAALASFAAPVTFANATSTSVATGDFNRDGKPDFVISTIAGLQVYLNTTPAGTTTPSFAAPATFSSFNAGLLAVADFNRDGALDIANLAGGGQLQFYFNTAAAGSPTASFAGSASSAFGFTNTSFVAADLNGDGNVDLAAGGGVNQLFVLRNDTPQGAAAPTIGEPQSLSVPSGASFIAAADFSGDGKIDIFGTAQVLTNTTPIGGATFTFSVSGNFTLQFGGTKATGDFNGDGKIDIIAGANSSPIPVLINTTAPGATAPTFAVQTFTLGSTPRLAAVGDFNRDGRLDASIADSGNSTVNLLMNTTLGISDDAGLGTITDDDTTTPPQNLPPVINSASFSPESPFPGDAVTFTVAASDPEGQPLTIGYNYGDGSSDNTGVHTYAAPGTYTVTVSVSDGVNTVTQTLTVDVLDSGGNGALGDRDGDGFDDFIETALLTDPNSNKSRPFDLPKPTLADASGLIIKKLSIRIRAGKPKLNSLLLSGSLPASANFTPQGKPIIVSIGGVVRSFVSDKQGFSPIGTAFDKIRFARARGGRVKFDLKLTKGTFTTVAREGGSVRVIVIFENQRFELLVPAK